MPDQVLTRDGPVTVPLDYVVPASGELIPRTVKATIDGTSAASNFYATLQVLAPSGQTMFSAISSAIAAGASADVSWFPRVGGSGSSGSGLTQIFQSTVGAGGAASIDTSGTAISNATNNILGVFVGSGNSGAKNPDQLQVHFNADAGSNYQTTGLFGNQAQSGIPGTANTLANNAASDAVVGLVNGGGGTPEVGTYVFLLPRIWNANQRANLVSFGGYNDGSVARIGVYNVRWTFTTVSRMTFFLKASNFVAGSTVTLWSF